MAEPEPHPDRIPPDRFPRERVHREDNHARMIPCIPHGLSSLFCMPFACMPLASRLGARQSRPAEVPRRRTQALSTSHRPRGPRTDATGSRVGRPDTVRRGAERAALVSAVPRERRPDISLLFRDGSFPHRDDDGPHRSADIRACRGAPAPNPAAGGVPRPRASGPGASRRSGLAHA